MSSQNVESHVLVIFDGAEPREVLLNAATYSIGRDRRNSIVIPHGAISRQHALLLRVPAPEQRTYRYRIIDGNISGQPSLNGVSINGTSQSNYELQSGDKILLGGAVQAEYSVLKLPSDNKYSGYLKFQTPEYQSIKAKPVSASSTLVGNESAEPSEVLVASSDHIGLVEIDADNPPTELFGRA
jgi:pSer/pThr/pTyr-binding forkhead associated (FHA) protein